MSKTGRWTLGATAAVAVGIASAVAVARSGESPPAEPPDAAEELVQEAPRVTVYKSPQCGCCAKWVDHLREAGFQVTALDVEDVSPVKREHGITAGIASCHTATVDGYVIEGHVPADVIARLLEERPEVKGLAVPGMPIGSPGMEGPREDPYDILAFDADGRTRVYESRP